MAADPISAAINAGLGIAQTVAAISDMNKRREFAQNVQLLSLSQQNQLNQQLLLAKTDSERLKIASDAGAMIRSTAVTGIASKQNVTLIVVSLTAIMALGIVVFYYK